MVQLYLIVVLLLILAGLYALSTPYVCSKLLLSLERYGPLDPEAGVGNARAIVILSADYAEHAPEFGRQTVGRLSLDRLRYGAWLHRHTGLPILVAGGKPANAEHSLADAMRMALVDEFRVPVRWIEDESLSTLEHAQQVPRIMAAEGIEEVLLITHAWHMRRAVSAFEYFGQKVIPAPTCFTQPPTPIITDFRPGPRWLNASYFAIYERLALGWYRYRYFPAGRQPERQTGYSEARYAVADEDRRQSREEPLVQGEQMLVHQQRSPERTS